MVYKPPVPPTIRNGKIRINGKVSIYDLINDRIVSIEQRLSKLEILVYIAIGTGLLTTYGVFT